MEFSLRRHLILPGTDSLITSPYGFAAITEIGGILALVQTASIGISLLVSTIDPNEHHSQARDTRVWTSQGRDAAATRMWEGSQSSMLNSITRPQHPGS